MRLNSIMGGEVKKKPVQPSRFLDLSKANPEADGIHDPITLNLIRNMKVELVPRAEGEPDPLEALVDFLMAVKRRRDEAARRSQGSESPSGQG